MAVRYCIISLVLFFLTTSVLCGSRQDGARDPAVRKAAFGQISLLYDNYTLSRTGGSLQSRQIQGCQQDPSSNLCANSTVCCSSEYPICCVTQEYCCAEGSYCCAGQQNCCYNNDVCCPKETCCSADENCFGDQLCCPKTAPTCGRSDFCLLESQTCCDGSPDGFCDTGLDCVKTANGSAACCNSGQTACNGGYCCDEGYTCSGGGICLPPQSSTTSRTQPPQTSSTGSAASATSTPGTGVRFIEVPLAPLLSVVLLLIPFGLLL